jgi:short-subunit dehydrogenase
MKKKAIIIGATSGIGKALADTFILKEYSVGLAGRRISLLDDLKKKNPDRCFTKYLDVSQTTEAINQFKELITEMEGVDIVVISSGVGYDNKDLQWSPEKETIDVNVSGFTAMANVAMHHFLSKGTGHLVSISSIAALRGDGDAPAYNASKAFVSNYVEGLRKKVTKLGLPISVTDIQPGFVNTAMAKGDGLFWVASPQKASQQICDAIERKKKHAYITKRWRLIACLMKVMPDFIYNRI